MNPVSTRILATFLGLALCLSARPMLQAAGPDLGLGDAAPPLRVVGPDGTEAHRAELSGKVVVLEFWATWCSPCLPALDHLGRLRDELADEDLVFLGISPESPERMQRFLATRDVAFPVVLDVDGATFDAYGVTIVPTTIVIDRQGRIAARTRPDALSAAALRRVLTGEPAGIEFVRDVAGNIDWQPEDSADGEVYARVVIAESEAGSGGMRFQPGSGRISGDGVHRDNLVQIAFDAPRVRTVSELSPWSKDDPVYKFSVLAPGGDDALARRMLAGAIQVKFRFDARHEERELDALVLRLGPNASPWRESRAPEDERTFAFSGGGLTTVGQPLSLVCGWFENMRGKPVVDETGLLGRYDLELEWVDGASFEAELARLGLQLVPERRSIQVLVVEPL